jgi:hypothetical protein
MPRFRVRVRRAGAFALALLLPAGLMVTLASPAAAAPACTATGALERADARSAKALAVACGHRVEVLERRNEIRQEFANPDGTTTVQQWSAPVRTRGADGTWRSVDTRLHRAADGTVVPQATVRPVRLSTGGAVPLATVDTPGGPLTLSWPAALPAPTLDGDTAVYPDVLAGVDLRVRALPEGFTFVLVVRTREAATSGALREIRLRLSTGGGAVTAQADGSLEVRNGKGEPMGQFGAAAMWDSAGGGSSPLDAGPSARTGQPRVAMDGADLVLRPDQELLTDPATVLPVFVDPPFQSGWNIWAYANNRNNTHPTEVARLGNDPDGNGIFRSFWRFPAWDLQGSTILNASMFVKVVHTWSCAATAIDLYSSGSIPNGGRVLWSPVLNGAPLSERFVNAHKGSGSCGNQPDAWVEFSDWFPNLVQSVASAYGSWVEVATTAQRWNYSTGAPFGESDTALWKKIDPASVYMTATFNHPPNAPVAQPISDCYKACSSPAVTRSVQPQLSATVSDPDGGTLNAEFEVWNQSSTTLVQSSGTTVSGVASGGVARWRPPSALAVNTQYTWRVRACDANVCGGWLGWQTLRTDSSRPAVPGVSSTVYREDTTGTVNGGVGVPGAFTFTAGGSTDVVEYTWSLDGSTPVTVPVATPGQPVTLDLTPVRDLLAVLQVTSRDAAGNVSDPRVYRFRVTPPPSEAAGWRLNEASGNVAADHVDGRPATKSGPVTWGAPGRAAGDTAARFTTDGYFETSLPVLDTTASFSVAAWVKLTDTTGYRVIAGQDGTLFSMFQIQYRPIENHFCLAARSADTSGASETFACAPGPPQVNTWVHLAGVYDAVRHTLTFYVNAGDPDRGGSITEVSFASAWSATGHFSIGRNLHEGAKGGWFTGDIDEVLAFPRALPLEEVQFLSFN